MHLREFSWLRADNFPETVIFSLKTAGHFSFSAGEKAGTKTNIFIKIGKICQNRPIVRFKRNRKLPSNSPREPE
jgi:hypothetical protein